MLIRNFFTSGLAINSYLIFDEETKRAAVIDPTRQIELYLSQALQDKVEITDIIETHVHADFISGAKELKARLSGKPTIHCSGMGGKEWIPHYADHIVQNNDEIHLGPLRLQAVHTPGHTPEHLMWLAFDEKRNHTVPQVAFSGDLLFVGSVGRPDLLGDELEEKLTKQLYKTLLGDLYHLPDFIEVYPSHGAGSLCGKEIGTRLSTTLGYEKRCNPWLIPQDFNRWRKSLMTDVPAAPEYFKKMKQINVEGLNVREVPRGIPLITTSEMVKQLSATSIVIDTRPPEAFAENHLKGSISLPFSPHLPVWAGIVIPEDKDILLVLNNSSEAVPVIQALMLVGIEKFCGLCDASQWDKVALKDLLTTSSMINVNQLSAERDQYTVLDVRMPSEWNSGHISGAHHLELAKALGELQNLPRDKPLAVVCRSGNRASIVASLLSRAGIVGVKNVQGGMEAWALAGLPTT